MVLGLLLRQAQYSDRCVALFLCNQSCEYMCNPNKIDTYEGTTNGKQYCNSYMEKKWEEDAVLKGRWFLVSDISISMQKHINYITVM